MLQLNQGAVNLLVHFCACFDLCVWMLSRSDRTLRKLDVFRLVAQTKMPVLSCICLWETVRLSRNRFLPFVI